MVTRRGGGGGGGGGGQAYSLVWPIRGCAAGQSTVREQNLDTLDTN